MSPAEKLLRELIALPSVNPAFMPPHDRRAGEQRVADFLTVVAAEGRLDVERREVWPGRFNVLARLLPAKSKQRVVLAPHMDTIGDALMPDSMFVPKRKGDRLFGRGACDTKGSIAAMLGAVAYGVPCASKPPGSLPHESDDQHDVEHDTELGLRELQDAQHE